MDNADFQRRVVSVLDGLGEAVWAATVKGGIYVDGLTTTITEIKDLVRETEEEARREAKRAALGGDEC